ncbi:MAG: NirD/YgiW/YdeI family stress tolerance protein [Desulfovibrio sp.]|jgi:uncharacterized protein (TIGR00156 family)|nr:NirD/YgiW/YdeI family stress tolerance protein [Desulfovibrio sp.]
MFQDGPGTVHVKIDHDIWAGWTITAQNIVEIQGEIDKDRKRVK